MKFANQGGYQPAIVEGLVDVLNENDCFTTTENHIDFPNSMLRVPKMCIGIIERSLHNDREGSVSILFKDTVTARRLIRRAEEGSPVKIAQKKPDSAIFGVVANEDYIINSTDAVVKSLSWEPKMTVQGARWENKIVTHFIDKQEAVALYTLLRIHNKSGAMKNWA